MFLMNVSVSFFVSLTLKFRYNMPNDNALYYLIQKENITKLSTKSKNALQCMIEVKG